MCGTHISHACFEAIRISRSNRYIRLTASPKKCAQALEWEFELNRIREASKYHASAKGKRAAEKRRDEIIGRQQMVDYLMQSARGGVLKTGLDATIEWTEKFCEPSDDCGVSFDKSELYQMFYEAGYIENDFVGIEPSDFDQNKMGRYIVGQVMNCLGRGMPPHPVCKWFCKQYWGMTSEKQLTA